MIRPLLRFFIALCACLSISLTAPALAFAHGYAHAELVEHSRESHHAAPATVSVATVGNDAQHDSHAHPAVDLGVSPRVIQALASVAPPPPLCELVLRRSGTVAPRPTPCESPPDPGGSRSQQPRAPPLF